VVSVRVALQPFNFAGERVRAGSRLIYSPYVTHRLPELWPEPLTFEPERWNPQLPGYCRPAPHEYLPFGGGPHRCVGALFAVTEMTVLLEQILGRTSLKLESADPRPVGFVAMRPRHGPIARVLAVQGRKRRRS
jgi:cytochrome P450